MAPRGLALMPTLTASILTALVRAALGLAALAFVAASPAQARLIGLVFDDSGSMGGHIHTPTFGVQLLASTLDGRDGADRLVTLLLSDLDGLARTNPDFGRPPDSDDLARQALGRLRASGKLVEEAITPARLQGTIEDLRRRFGTPRGNTPYLAIEVMLAALAETVRPGETAHLVVLTDGEFENVRGAPPRTAASELVPGDPDRLRRAYEGIKAGLTAKAARIKVDFLVIGLGKPPSFFDGIDGQCVRPILLSVFNGSRDTLPITTCREPHVRTLPGYHNVGTAQEMIEGLHGLVAELSGMDRRIGAQFVRPEGASIVIESPLSITRLLTIATAATPAGGNVLAAPPRIGPLPFPAAPPLTLASRMEGGDSEAGNVRQSGTTTQFAFAPRPLPAGTYRLPFDRAVGADVRIVLQTAARLELDVLGPDDKPAPRDAAGRVTIPARAPHRLVATLVDETASGPRPVPLDSLRSQVAFTGHVEAGNLRQPVSLARDGTGDRALGPFTIDEPGTRLATVEAALDGFLTLSSRPLQIVAIDPRTTFEIGALTGIEDCPGCPANTVRTTFDNRPRAGEIAEVTVTPRGQLGGRATLDRSGVPAWLSLVDSAGTTLDPDAEIAVEPGRPIRLLLVRDARSCAGVQAASEPVVLRLVAAAPLSGAAEVRGTVRVEVTPARLRFDAPHGQTDEGGRLLTTAFSLVAAEDELRFRLDGACSDPKPEEFAARTATRFVGATVRPVAEGIAVAPRISPWCACFAFVDRGPQPVQVGYRGPGGLQTADASATFVVAPTLREHLACLAAFLALLWLLVTAVVALRTERFPRGSVIEIREGTQLPRYADLRGYNWTAVKAGLWLFRWLARMTTIPHERQTIEGLRLVARPGGLVTQVDRDTHDFELRGQRLTEMFELNPKLRELRINWSEEIEVPGKPRVRLRFLRSMADAGQA